jgi:uncharacterized BrkB/YihY/UPF0761 family membrane protein
MLDDPLGLEDAELPEVVRWAGLATLGLTVLGPTTYLAVAGVPALADVRVRVVVLAFGPAAVAGLATGLGYRSVPADRRAGTWPALPAAVLAVLLPAAVALVAALGPGIGG